MGNANNHIGTQGCRSGIAMVPQHGQSASSLFGRRGNNFVEKSSLRSHQISFKTVPYMSDCCGF